MMKLLDPRLVVHLLLALAGSSSTRRRPHSKQRTTAATTGCCWIIDGHNLLGHRGTPRDADALTAQLQPMAAAANDKNNEVILVLDGQPDGGAPETEIIVATEIDGDSNSNRNFQRVNLGRGLSADGWILDAARARNKPNAKRRDQGTRIRVVTADRKLRRAVRQIKPVVKDVVNPVTFWRRYRPRLSGYKTKNDNREAPAPANDDDDNDNGIDVEASATTQRLEPQEQQQQQWWE